MRPAATGRKKALSAPGVTSVHIPLAVPGVGNHAQKKQPTMQNLSVRNCGRVAHAHRSLVCNAGKTWMPRQKHMLGVSIVHIPRVRVAVPHGRAQPATMSRSSRSGRVKTALSNHVHSAGRRWSRKRKPIPCVQRAVIHRVRLVVAHGHAKVVTMSKICLRGHVQPV